MFRKRNSSISFSITSFVNSAIPSFTSDSNRFLYCVSTGQDLLYAHQLASKNPYALDERSVFVAGIVDKEGPSRTVFGKLQKHNILDAEGNVNTMNIGRKFMHQLAVLDQRRQKQLINLLFWWEEECHRLRKLNDEEAHLSATIKGIEKRQHEGEGDAEARINVDGEAIPEDDQERQQLLDHLRFEREKVRMRMRQRPSQRRADVEAGTDTLSHQVSGRAQSLPDTHYSSAPLGLSRTADAKVMEPPAYRP